MKFAFTLASISFGLVVGSHAVLYNFSSYTYGDGLPGQDEWTTNNNDEQYSVVDFWNDSKALVLGDAHATNAPPTTSSVGLTHAYESVLGESKVDFAFTIRDSVNRFLPDYETIDSTFANRDRFGVSLTNGATNILGIYFNPTAQTLLPGTPPDASWTLSYSLDGGLTTLPLNLQIYEGGTYLFNLQVTPNTNPLLSDFAMSITGSNTLTDTQTAVALDPSSTTGEFNVLWDQIGEAAFGSNSIYIDNLNLVPETSSSLLVCLAGLGFISRRRRA